jgi:gluconate 2-dehydrogenase gamma chain
MKTDRRELLKVLAATPVLASAQGVKVPVSSYKPQAFTANEWKTIQVLSDIIIPADERSGSATQAGVPEYIDEVTMDRRVHGGVENRFEAQLRGGLAWLDAEARRRFERDFAACQPAQQKEIVELIAWPRKAAPEYARQVAFFNRFRDMVASGFYTSKIGIDDLGYKGNKFVNHWDGCPPEVLAKLGL